MSNNSNRQYLFTSESVSEGHPDKLCDQISDAMLDECLKLDSGAHVACETFATTNFVLIGGEMKFSKNAEENIAKIRDGADSVIRNVAREVGYNSESCGLDYRSMRILNLMHAQSADIAQGVEGEGLSEFRGQQGAGDQGIMFGFACDETKALLSAPIVFAHKILQYAARLRKDGTFFFLRPDAKSQVTVLYDGYKPIKIDTIVVSHQHDPSAKYEDIKAAIIDGVIKPVLGDTGLLAPDTKFFINPTGSFVTGGPDGDAGLTGRKIIVDTYGGAGRHGGGAFSGKDPSKVDRSGAYMARYIAKNVVAAKLAARCEVQLAYAIGVPFPVSIMVDTFGTNTCSEEKIEAAVKKVFDCTPAGIIKTLDLLRPIYRATSCYGHFGRAGFPWEECNKAEELKELCK